MLRANVSIYANVRIYANVSIYTYLQIRYFFISESFVADIGQESKIYIKVEHF